MRPIGAVLAVGNGKYLPTKLKTNLSHGTVQQAFDPIIRDATVPKPKARLTRTGTARNKLIIPCRKG
jgi:hypothetical protein